MKHKISDVETNVGEEFFTLKLLNQGEKYACDTTTRVEQQDYLCFDGATICDDLSSSVAIPFYVSLKYIDEPVNVSKQITCY